MAMEHALQNDSVPQWLRGIGHPTTEDRRRGVRGIVHTDRGDIPFRLALSVRLANAAKERYPDDLVLIVNPSKKNGQIVRAVVRLVDEARQKLSSGDE